MARPTATASESDGDPAATGRAPLTRDRVLRAGVELADAEGIASLSMRKLGDAVDVEAMSLYNHVTNKSDLLDGMVDLVFAEIRLPVAGETWRASMVERATSARAVLARHPWAITMLEARASPGPATLAHHDAVIGSLLAAGFPIRLAAHALAALDAFTYGFALAEATLPFETPDETVDLADGLLDAMPVDQLPHLAALTTQVVLAPGYDFGDEFAFGLDLVLDGLERALDAC